MTESTATEEALAADPALEVEDQTAFDPSLIPPDLTEDELFASAQQKASLKQYDHTFFEVFEDQLEGSLAATEATLTVEVADSILKAWPWLRYVDLDMYLSYRSGMLREAIKILHDSYPKEREKLFKENVDDWKLHRKAYMELMVQWTALSIRWGRRYEALKLSDRKKAVLHCVVADLMYIIVGPEGMINKFQYLAYVDHPDYAVTAEESIAMGERIKELSDE